MIDPKNISIKYYDYDLAREKIAQFPTEQRDKSKLLIYQKGIIQESHFYRIPYYIPDNSLMIFNNTKVISARITFHKETGAKIEIFCLEPIAPHSEIRLAFQQKTYAVWKCFIGNSRRWKSGKLSKTIEHKGRKYILYAERIQRQGNASLVEFTWQPEDTMFSEIMDISGSVPLPPYINRDAVEIDKKRYQTVYAKHEGSVAAPTAGLHFTDNILRELKVKGIQNENIILHVGAGTFKPVSTEKLKDHEMHAEHVIIDRKTILNIINKAQHKIISVGTTTVRAVESLYWFGVKLIIDKSHIQEFNIKQWDPYQEKYNIGISSNDSLQAVIDFMDENSLETLSGITRLIIAPNYKFRITEGIISNFHQPKSTLLLLIAAFIGDDWKKIYDYALSHNFRFLSYGDSCLLLP